MKSIYKRQFAAVAGMILISFSVLGTSFAMLSYQYTIREKRETLERNANHIASFTAALVLQHIDVYTPFYQNYVTSIAIISDAQIMVCAPGGQIIYVADGSGDPAALPSPGSNLAQSMVTQIAQNGSFSGMTTLDGIYPESRYVAATNITVATEAGNVVIGMVLVSAETARIIEMWRGFSGIFLLTAAVVFLLAAVIASVTAYRQAKPLQEMAEAARKFGHGIFDVRVDPGARVDEVGQLAMAFNNMADSLSKAEARRSEFISNVSHELKTPMTTIAGFADGILDETIPPERRRDAVALISSETRRLSRLVRNMLDLSRIQADNGVLTQEQFEIGELIARVLVSLEPKIMEKQLDVIVHLPESSLSVWGDPDAITQVGYNLLDNAIKFSHEGGHLWVSVVAQGTKALVSVKNEGETIPADELPLVFDRFHKTDKSRSGDREGMGLGLYIVKTILNSHKEQITATSHEGVTEFLFTLTLAT